MDILRNQSGTTKPAFRIGAKGVELISRAIQDSNLDSKALLQLKNKPTGADVDIITSNLSERDAHNIDVIDPEAPYDSTIPKSELVSYSIDQREGVIVLWVKDGYVKLPLSVDLSNIQDANAESVVGVGSAIVGHVPVYSATNGKRITDSGYGIVNQIRERTAEELANDDPNDDGTGNQDNLVTENALLDYVGIPKNRLKARLDGTLGNDPYMF